MVLWESEHVLGSFSYIQLSSHRELNIEKQLGPGSHIIDALQPEAIAPEDFSIF